jgi:hypothetical protein
MERRLPTGGATNRLEIGAREQPHEFAIRTTTGPTPCLYHYRFAGENGTTVIQLHAQVDMAGVATVMPNWRGVQSRTASTPIWRR